MPRRKRWPTEGVSWTDNLERLLHAALIRNHRLVAALCQLGMDREDIVQECRIEVWRSLSLWPPTKVNLSTAVYHVCANYLRDLLTLRNRMKFVPTNVTISLEAPVADDSCEGLIETIPDESTDVEREALSRVQIERLRCYALQHYGDWLVSVIDQMMNGKSVYQSGSPYSYNHTMQCLRACHVVLDQFSDREGEACHRRDS